MNKSDYKNKKQQINKTFARNAFQTGKIKKIIDPHGTSILSKSNNVKFWQYKDNFLHFLIQICAIIGGIFSVTGIIDALVHKSVAVLLRKANAGKLG
jgi:hypothetical protein